MNPVSFLPDSLEASGLLQWLEAASPRDMDDLKFGIVAMAPDGTVERYNLAEARRAGLSPARVIGRNFFTSVALCTNNAIVGHRFEIEPEIDDMIDYVFTFRLMLQKVRLRLIKHPHARLMYLGIEPRH